VSFRHQQSFTQSSTGGLQNQTKTKRNNKRERKHRKKSAVMHQRLDNKLTWSGAHPAKKWSIFRQRSDISLNIFGKLTLTSIQLCYLHYCQSGNVKNWFPSPVRHVGVEFNSMQPNVPFFFFFFLRKKWKKTSIRFQLFQSFLLSWAGHMEIFENHHLSRLQLRPILFDKESA